MNRTIRPLASALAAVFAIASASTAVSAQIAWDAPSLMAPGAPDGWGFHLVDTHPGGGVGVMAAYRGSPAPVGLGWRIGIAEGYRDDLGVFGGLDVSGAMYSSDDPDVPVDVIWHSGVGAGLDGDVLVTVPAGIVVGVLLDADGVLFRPYAGPKVVLDMYSGDRGRFGRGRDDLELGAVIELGIDLAFPSGWIIRAAATGGEHDALSIGFHAPG